jgi:hypothetical protein
LIATSSPDGTLTWKVIEEDEARQPRLGHKHTHYEGPDLKEAIVTGNKAVTDIEARGFLWRNQYSVDEPAWFEANKLIETAKSKMEGIEDLVNKAQGRQFGHSPKLEKKEKDTLSHLPHWQPKEMEGRDLNNYAYINIDDVSDGLATALVYNWPHQDGDQKKFETLENGEECFSMAIEVYGFEDKFSAIPETGDAYAIEVVDRDALADADDTRVERPAFFAEELIEIDQFPKDSSDSFLI